MPKIFLDRRERTQPQANQIDEAKMPIGFRIFRRGEIPNEFRQFLIPTEARIEYEQDHRYRHHQGVTIQVGAACGGRQGFPVTLDRSFRPESCGRDLHLPRRMKVRVDSRR